MEKVLKELQEYQLEALRKGISFDLGMYTVEEQTELSVKMSYLDSDATEIYTDTRTFCTTFSNNVDNITDRMKMGRIKKFIDNVEE